MKTMGAAMAYAPVVQLLRTRITEAAPAVAPLRVICIYEPYQVNPYFYPQGVLNGAASGVGADAGAPFTLNFANSALAPYIPYQSQMIVLRGLNRVDPQMNATAGHMASATTFTGAKCSYGAAGSSLTTSGTSIDNYLFNRMKLVSPSLLGPMNIAWPTQGAGISYNGTPNSGGVTAFQNPLTLYNTYFANYHSSSNSTTPSNLSIRRNAVFAGTLSHLQQLRTRLATSEGAVLDAHISAVQGLQSQINGTSSNSASCAPPQASAMTNDTGNGTPNYADFNSDFNNWISLITQAFACDITRTATIDIGEPMALQSPDIFSQITTQINGNLTGKFSGSPNDYHGLVSHGTNGILTTKATNPDLQMACYGLFFQQKIAALMASLQATPDPYNPNQTLLDNTVILMASEHANQEPWANSAGNTGVQGTDSHSYADGKFILLGGCGGLFKGNQIIAGTPRIIPFSAGLANWINPLVNATPNNSSCASYYMGMPHNALLTTIVNAVEYNLGQFSSTYTPNLLSWYGEPTLQSWNKKTWAALNLGQTGF